VCVCGCPGFFCPIGTGVLSFSRYCDVPTSYCPQSSASKQPTADGWYALATAQGLFYNQSVCEAGKFCIAGVARLCPAGRYGDVVGSTSVTCVGNCTGGYFCPSGSTQRTQQVCGFQAVYCPEVGVAWSATAVAYSLLVCCKSQWGVYVRCWHRLDWLTVFLCTRVYLSATASQGTSFIQSVSVGFYSEPEAGDSDKRISQSLCPAGWYCVGGARRQCPAGTYGALPGLSSESCSGPCIAGYYCPQGSVFPKVFTCGDVSVYCPVGSGAPIVAAPGELTVDGAPSTRSGKTLCPASSYCVGGVALPCRAGWFGCATGLGTSDCKWRGVRCEVCARDPLLQRPI